MGEQHIARHENQFERDEKGEEIAGQDGQADASSQHEQHRANNGLVTSRRCAALANREDVDHEDGQGGNDEDQCGELVGNEDDAQLGVPSTDAYDSGAVALYVDQQCNGGKRGGRQAHERDRVPQVMPFANE